MNPNPRSRAIELSLVAHDNATKWSVGVAIAGSLAIAEAMCAFMETVFLQLSFAWYRLWLALFSLVMCWILLRYFYTASRALKHWRSATSNLVGMATATNLSAIEHYGDQAEAAVTAATK